MPCAATRHIGYEHAHAADPVEPLRGMRVRANRYATGRDRAGLELVNLFDAHAEQCIDATARIDKRGRAPAVAVAGTPTDADGRTTQSQGAGSRYVRALLVSAPSALAPQVEVRLLCPHRRSALSVCSEDMRVANADPARESGTTVRAHW
jgi:hypothetical protein